jgi:hypothetical protein
MKQISTGTRDPEMHSTKKGNPWHFGMKAHIGVDADSGLVHTVVGTAANVHDVTQAHAPGGNAREARTDQGTHPLQGNSEKIHPWIFSDRFVAAHVRDGLRESTTYVVVRVGASCPKRETLNDSAFPQHQPECQRWWTRTPSGFPRFRTL